MRRVLIVIRNGALAAAIAVGLGFGAAEALSRAPEWASVPLPCTFPDYCDSSEWCAGICYAKGYASGMCRMDLNCCVCFD